MARLAIEVWWRVNSRSTLILNTNPGGVRSTHSRGVRRGRNAVVAAVDLDDRELRGVVVQPRFGCRDSRRIEAARVDQRLVGPGRGADHDVRHGEVLTKLRFAPITRREPPPPAQLIENRWTTPRLSRRRQASSFRLRDSALMARTQCINQAASPCRPRPGGHDYCSQEPRPNVAGSDRRGYPESRVGSPFERPE